MKLPPWLSRHRHTDAELDEEIRAHLEERAEELMACGMSSRDAMAAAKRKFGNVSVLTERSRDVWRWQWVETLRMDVLYALRLIERYPAFSVNVILISAIGIAACAATFSLVSGVLLAPLPFATPEQVYSLELHSMDGQETAAVPADAYLGIAARTSPVIEAIGAGAPSRAVARWGDEPVELRVLRITPSFLKVFSIRPERGRLFTDADAAQAAPVLILSHTLWQSRFRGDAAAVGKTIVLDSLAYTVIGVMPPLFRAHFSTEPDVWVPMRVSHAAGGRNIVNAEVRLRDGVSAEAAEQWLASVTRVRMEAASSRDSVEARAALIPIREMVYGDVAKPLRMLLAAVLLVLLLISANIATMFLGRSSSRDHELMVRRALGASSRRQLAQLVTESVVLVGIGGVLGITGSIWLVAAVQGLGTAVVPRLDYVAVNWNVMLLAVAATLCTGVLGGLPPAFAARRDVRNPGGGARVTGKRASSLLVVGQISLAMMLLVGAGLLAKSFLRILPSEPGFTFENRLAIMVPTRAIPAPAHGDSNVARWFETQVSERMRNVRGVRDVAAMSFAPFFGSVSSSDVRLIGRPNPDKPYRAYQNIVTPNLHGVLGIPIRRGRDVTDRDVAGSEPVVVINEVAAARWWPSENPVGKRVAITQGDDERIMTVVGVMANARMFGSTTRVSPEIHLPIAQNASGYVTFIVHTDASGVSSVHDLKRAVWSVAPHVPLTNVDDLSTYLSKSVSRPRFFAWAMGAFALVAVVLSATAVYGLLTLDVVQRKREIGVRMALGATGPRIGSLVLKRATLLAVTGVLAGALLARALSRYLESLLVEVSATDAWVFAATASLALVLACLAACAPAYRAIRVDPATSLRGE